MDLSFSVFHLHYRAAAPDILDAIMLGSFVRLRASDGSQLSVFIGLLREHLGPGPNVRIKAQCMPFVFALPCPSQSLRQKVFAAICAEDTMHGSSTRGEES